MDPGRSGTSNAQGAGYGASVCVQVGERTTGTESPFGQRDRALARCAGSCVGRGRSVRCRAAEDSAAPMQDTETTKENGGLAHGRHHRF